MKRRELSSKKILEFIQHNFSLIWTIVTVVLSGIGFFHLQSYADFEGTNFLLIQQNTILIAAIAALFIAFMLCFLSFILVIPSMFKSCFPWLHRSIMSISIKRGKYIINTPLSGYFKLYIPSISTLISTVIVLIILNKCENYEHVRYMLSVPIFIFFMTYIASYLLITKNSKLWEIEAIIGIFMINLFNYALLITAISIVHYLVYKEIGGDYYYMITFIIVIISILINIAICSNRNNIFILISLVLILFIIYSRFMYNYSIVGGFIMNSLNIGGRIEVTIYYKDVNKIPDNYCLLIDRGSSVTVANITDEKPCVLKNDIRYDENITIPMSEIQSIVRKVKPKDEIVKEGA